MSKTFGITISDSLYQKYEELWLICDKLGLEKVFFDEMVFRDGLVKAEVAIKEKLKELDGSKGSEVFSKH